MICLRLPCLLGFLLFTALSSGWCALTVNAEQLGRNEESAFSYVRVTVRNDGGGKLSYRIETNPSYGNSGRIQVQAPPLEGGHERIHNLAIPYEQNVSINVIDSLGERRSVGVAVYGNFGKRFLHISEYAQFATAKEVDDFSKEYLALVRPSHVSYSSSSSATDQVVSQLEARDLPENWLCYAPFHSVWVRQATFTRLPGSAREALQQYVEGGGYLTLYASDRQTTEGAGLGVIEHRSASPFETSSSEFPAEWRRQNQVWQSAYKSGTTHDFPYSVQKPGGRTGAFLIATAFLILAGPINYFYYSRRGRIRMLVVSLPLISLGFCILITAFFIGTQGFARRGGTMSLSWLDERSDRGMAVARHSLYSGLYPLGGFKFGRDTALLPVNAASDYEIELTNGLQLKEGIFQPGANFHYFTVTPFHTREHLVYDAAARNVMNGFEKPLHSLVLVDDGRYYASGRIEPGMKATLEPVAAAEVAAHADPAAPGMAVIKLLAQRSLDSAERTSFENRMMAFAPPVATDGNVLYAVLMTQNPEPVQPGVQIDAERNSNIILGVLDSTTTGTNL